MGVVARTRETESTVINALDALLRLDLELVVIIRGGGSKTDLYSLDNEVIAKMISGLINGLENRKV